MNVVYLNIAGNIFCGVILGLLWLDRKDKSEQIDRLNKECNDYSVKYYQKCADVNGADIIIRELKAKLDQKKLHHVKLKKAKKK